MAREECDGPDYATLAAADGLAARVAHIHSSASRAQPLLSMSATLPFIPHTSAVLTLATEPNVEAP